MKIISSDISIKKICFSGQCFRFREIKENRYSIIAFGKYLEIEQNGNEIEFYCDEKEYYEIWHDYFDFNTDYQISIPSEDTYLTKAAEFGKGIRILKQDTWEMIVSFIVSQQNNIKRIQKIIELLCQRYGEKKEQNGIIYNAFPSIEALSCATEQQLKECNLGYRSKYIIKTANDLLQQQSIENLKNMNYNESKKELMKLYGVGEKVADCICLFGLHHLEAFPIDTHIKKILETQYSNGFPFSRYAGYEGVIQQYLFYYDLFGGKNV